MVKKKSRKEKKEIIKYIEEQILPMPERDCFLCFEFTLEEFTEEKNKICAEHWLDAENCPNWRLVDVKVNNKKIIWVESR